MPDQRRHRIETHCSQLLQERYKIKYKEKRLKNAQLSLPLCCSPIFVFLFEISLNPGDGDGGPDASPNERKNPTDLAKLVKRSWREM